MAARRWIGGALAGAWMAAAALCLPLARASGESAPAVAAAGSEPLPAPLRGEMPSMKRALETIRGHRFRAEVPVATLGEPEVRAYLAAKLQRDYPDEKIEQERKAYVHFGFLKPDQDLKRLFLQMLTEQAAGFYDPEAGRLFLVRGREFPGIALVHELAHALQDQTFAVEPILDRCRDNDDALLAAQSMIEGEAMALASRYESLHPAPPSGPADGAGGGADRTAEESRQLLGRMPEVLQANLMFPYTKGMAWAGAVVAAGGEALMDEMYRHPPESSEQILHPEKIRAPRDRPSAIDMSLLSDLEAPLAAAGYRPVKTNVLGEFNIGQLFGGQGDQEALSAASGWDGDLYRVLEKQGGGTALIWLSVWDSADDAGEFRARATVWLRGRHPDGGFEVGSPAEAVRAVYLVEGFEPALARRLSSTLAAALPRHVTWR